MFDAAPVTTDMIVNHIAGSFGRRDPTWLKIISEVDMPATSHDVMPDIELYQPTDEANALDLASTLGRRRLDSWWRSGHLWLVERPQ